MTMKITISIDAPELQADIRAISAALSAILCVTAEKMEVSSNRAQDEKTSQPVTVPKEVQSEPEEISLEDVRAAFVAKNSKANAPKLRAILAKFKVKKVTDLDPTDYPEVLKELEAL